MDLTLPRETVVKNKIATQGQRVDFESALDLSLGKSEAQPNCQLSVTSLAMSAAMSDNKNINIKEAESSTALVYAHSKSTDCTAASITEQLDMQLLTTPTTAQAMLVDDAMSSTSGAETVVSNKIVEPPVYGYTAEKDMSNETTIEKGSVETMCSKRCDFESNESIENVKEISSSIDTTSVEGASRIESFILDDAIKQTMGEVSRDIVQSVIDEAKLDSALHTQLIDDNAMDVPTPGTPTNKPLERVESGVDIQSMTGEESNMSFVSTTSREEETSDAPIKSTPKEVKRRRPQRRGDLSMLALNGSHMHDFGADKLHEYQWPQERKAEWYMLQEQVSDYLGVKSFKRKYQELERRGIEPNERVYLRDNGIVTEMQCDLGLTAIRSDLVHDLMARDYPQKYNEFLMVLKEKKKQQAIDKQKELLAHKNDKTKLEAMRKKAVKSSAAFNAMFNRTRRDERRAFFDIHSFEVQYPKSKFKILPPELTKIGAYPVAVIPGQFQDYYKKYTPAELRYMPINTAMYSSPRKMHNIYADPAPLSDNDSDAASVSTEASEVSRASELESMDSEIFREDELVDDEAGSQGGGKTKEEKKAEIESKVALILDKLKDKEETPKKRRGSKTSGTSTPVEQVETGRKRRRRVLDAAQQNSPKSTRTPKRQRRVAPVKEKENECSICNGTVLLNPTGHAEDLIQCAECKRYGHPSCLELTSEMISIIKAYPWQCMECKSCVECMNPQYEDKMLFCDHCDRGYHTFCVGLSAIPNGRWECPSCRPRQPPPPREQPPPAPPQQQDGEIPVLTIKPPQSSNATAAAVASIIPLQ